MFVFLYSSFYFFIFLDHRLHGLYGLLALITYQINAYGRISENIEKLIQSIDRTSKNTERILEEMKEEQKESRMAMDNYDTERNTQTGRKSEVVNIIENFLRSNFLSI